MTRSKRSATLIVAALLFSTMLAGFASNSAAQADRPTLRFGVNAADLATLDPALRLRHAGPDRGRHGLQRPCPLQARQQSAAMEPDLATAIPEPKMDGGKQVWTFTCARRHVPAERGHRGICADGG